jgi:hypothetical protein
MLRSNVDEMIPIATVRVAQTALEESNRCLKLREQFGTLFSDQAFTALFPKRGQPAEAPWRLALVTVLQFQRTSPSPCAINFQRLTDYWSGTPPAQTRTSAFARLGQWIM